jgi:hypothetical protein
LPRIKYDGDLHFINSIGKLRPLGSWLCAATLPVSVVQLAIYSKYQGSCIIQHNYDGNINSTGRLARIGTRNSPVIALEEGEDGVWSRRTVVASTGILNHGLEFTYSTGKQRR